MLTKILNIFLEKGIKLFDLELIADEMDIDVSVIQTRFPDFKNLVEACLELQIKNIFTVQIYHQKKYTDAIESMYTATILGMSFPRFELFFNEVTEVYPDLFKNHIVNYNNKIYYLAEYLERDGIENGYINTNINSILRHSIYSYMYVNLNNHKTLRKYFDEKIMIKEFNLLFMMGMFTKKGQIKLQELINLDFMKY